MWRRGWVDWNEKTYYWQAQVFAEPSEFGIGGGRVSKLQIHERANRDSPLIYRWDRGPDIEKAPLELLQKVIKRCEKRR